MNNSNDSFKYDVALSFLKRDLKYAKQLATDLEPELSTFVYARKKEDLLGQDGMDRFAVIFRREARLTVILYRDGWGGTPWTAFEESHIKDRALHSRMTSFLVIRLDDSDLPPWVPATHMYTSTKSDTHSELLRIIKVLARQQGATLKKETAVEYGVRRKKKLDAATVRAEKLASYAAVGEVCDEVKRLFQHLIDAIESLKCTDPTADIEAGASGFECAIAGPRFSVSLVWQQPAQNTLSDARLRVGEWRDRVRVPSEADGRTTGPGWDGAIHYIPTISEDDEWVWVHNSSLDDDRYGSHLIVFDFSEPEGFRTTDLGEHLLLQFFEKNFPNVD